ncbi:MAG TPA: hypothetical protein VKX16_05610, partial [Chloroflexota bacterium]|nr:hypothetical protein [Chloroflexota bacterium]
TVAWRRRSGCVRAAEDRVLQLIEGAGFDQYAVLRRAPNLRSATPGSEVITFSARRTGEAAGD